MLNRETKRTGVLGLIFHQDLTETKLMQNFPLRKPSVLEEPSILIPLYTTIVRPLSAYHLLWGTTENLTDSREQGLNSLNSIGVFILMSFPLPGRQVDSPVC